MLKKITTLSVLFCSLSVYAQVGIDTETPKATLDVVGKPTETTVLDGLIAPRITGEQLRAKTYTDDQIGTLIYVTEADTSPSGQTEDVITEGYYYFNGSKWISTAGNSKNIYNSDDTFTADRSAYIPAGQYLNFEGDGIVGIGDVDPIAKLNVKGFIQFDSDSDYGVGKVFNDETGEKYGLTQSSYFPGTGDADSPGTRIYTSGAGVKGHISFGNYSSPTAYTEWGRFAQETGNFGINTINGSVNNNPTEKLDVNGNVRFRGLPINGSSNAIFTNTDGTRSSNRNQTFTATRTLVADANGVLGYVSGLPSMTNIYNANGTLTNTRTVTHNGNSLTFLGQYQKTEISSVGNISISGLPGADNQGSFTINAADADGNGSFSSLQMQVFSENTARIHAVNDTRSLTLGTSGNLTSAPVIFNTAPGGNANGAERMRITGEGNVGINRTSPTEKLHTNGNVRLQGLPANGATNAIYTTSGGGVSTSQNQTFTATRTVVADNNGVLGYVEGVPSPGPGVSKIVVSVGAIGTQNIGNANMLIANYPNEFIDTYSSWENNIFTVPANMGGLYSFSMQSSHTHTISSQTSWHVSAILQKSTDNGGNYTRILRDTNANLNGGAVDNGNAINWTGVLNAGDKIRLVYHSDSNTANTVSLGSITITKIAQ